jgi:hypothetical protein
MGNIKGTAINSLAYTGIVKLSQYIGRKKFTIAQMHNAGGKPLFDFLADCLVGDFEIAKLDRPTKILLLNEDENNNLSKANDTGFIYLTSKPEKVYDEAEGIVRYSFIIPQDIFANTNFNAVGLYTGTATTVDIEDYAAYCYIGTDVLNDISISSVLVLDWELHISNN